MILHKDFIFVHLQRTGGTFVSDYLLHNIENTVKHDSSSHEAVFNYRSDPTIKFGYIRNPYDWYLSLWSFTRKEYSEYAKSLFRDAKCRYDINLWIKSLFNNYSNLYPTLNLLKANSLDIGLFTFKYLCLFYHKDVFSDISNYKKYLLLDKVLLFENLRDELRNFFDENIFKLNDSQVNELYKYEKINISEHRKYTEGYYNKEVIDLLKYKDRIIFNEYNYEF